MRIGIVILPQAPWHEQAHLWRRAEDYGFDHARTYDHLAWRSLAGEPSGATIPLLTGAALVTSTIRVGTFVASPNYRHPAPFAKEVATVDDMSGGRFILGLGAGGTGIDATVLGGPVLPPQQRHERFVEFVESFDRLLQFERENQQGISFRGSWLTVEGARMVGEPSRRPRLPFAVAANGPRGIRLAAKFAETWITTGSGGDTVDQWWRRVRELALRAADAEVESGRTTPLGRMLSLDASPQYCLESSSAFDDAVGRAEDLGFTDVVAHWPRPAGVYAGAEAVLEEIAPAARR